LPYLRCDLVNCPFAMLATCSLLEVS
jgi:hypothetical protein